MWVPEDGTACMGKVRETVCAIAEPFNPNNMRIKLNKRIGRVITMNYIKYYPDPSDCRKLNSKQQNALT